MPSMYYDATEKLKSIASVLEKHDNILVPHQLQDAIDRAHDYLSSYRTPSPSPLPSPLSSQGSQCDAEPNTDSHVQYNVELTNRTMLSVLYTHPIGSVIEYPETSATGHVGHLFQVNEQSSWCNPVHGFAYSQGGPRGSTGTKTVQCPLLVDDNGVPVECKESHSTCQGSKICPFGDSKALAKPHCKASHAQLEERLALENRARSPHTPRKELFQRTLAFYVAIKKQGCLTPTAANCAPTDTCDSAIFVTDPDSTQASVLDRDTFQTQVAKARRGHPSQPICSGNILFEYLRDGSPFLRCEFYDRKTDIDHFINWDISRGIYETRYLEALFLNDREVIAEYEEEAALEHGIGPSTTCPTVKNFSTIKVNCSLEHRDYNGNLVIAGLEKLPCSVKFRIFEPIEEYRKKCPRILIICRKAHTHPIPLPSKTPPAIKNEIFDLLCSLSHDLPDITPRRLLRHAATRVYLRSKLPSLTNPTMIDLHPSLGNRDHLRSFILKAQEHLFPLGTGWKGLLHLKSVQDDTLSPEDHYIRRIIEIQHVEMTRMSTGEDDLHDDADMSELVDSEAPFRMIVCMSPEASSRLRAAQYLQCDIGFKRIAGFKEFELGGLDIETRITVTYCRVYLNRQNAVAHRLIFETIDEIVYQDTGYTLCWRHLHSTSISDLTVGILQVSVDQHGGQAKGLGMYLVSVAQKLPQRYDLHEPHRLVQDLNEYDHLRRLLRLCENHFFRNIKKTQVPENIRLNMRSLACIEHRSWDETLNRINEVGGKAGKAWLNDKVRAKFVFPAICWEKSFIPREVWQVGDRTTNIIESVHFDVNQEGVSCTLVGGVKKGHHFDILKFQTIKNIQKTGIRPHYHVPSISSSVTRSLKRKAIIQHKVLAAQDVKIEQSNKRLKAMYEAKKSAEHQLEIGAGESSDKGLVSVERTSRAYDSAVADSLKSIKKGSGKVGLLLPRFAPSSM